MIIERPGGIIIEEGKDNNREGGIRKKVVNENRGRA